MPQSQGDPHVPVLIVGGGPIGLTGSNLLSHHGVEHLLVNRRPATSDHPRARCMDMRSLEILRQVRLADAVIDTGVPPEWVSHVRYSTTLAEPEIWKLAFVLRGCAGPAILDTYETERREQSDRTRMASVDNARLAGDFVEDAMTASAPGESAAQALADSGYPIGIERVPSAALAANGLYATDEAVLVRPDGFVAARFAADAEVTETQLRDVTLAV